MKRKTRKTALAHAAEDLTSKAYGLPSRTTNNYARTLQQLADAETDLTRAQNRWQQLRKKAKRYEKRLDAEFKRRATDIPGQIDWRALAGTIIEEEGS
jgi:predicted  nucleic acid-binding Zn-ribbon protein